jgi:hypothetical protein
MHAPMQAGVGHTWARACGDTSCEFGTATGCRTATGWSTGSVLPTWAASSKWSSETDRRPAAHAAGGGEATPHPISAEAAKPSAKALAMHMHMRAASHPQGLLRAPGCGRPAVGARSTGSVRPTWAASSKWSSYIDRRPAGTAGATGARAGDGAVAAATAKAASASSLAIAAASAARSCASCASCTSSTLVPPLRTATT